MENLVATVEKTIKEKKGFIKKHQLPFWINEKIRSEEFDDLIKKLPLGLILSLRGGIEQNRSVLFLITKTKYSRVSECIKKRHPQKTDFPLKEMPPPIAYALRDKEGIAYITDPDINPLTKYMRKLVHDKQINAIYYTRVKTPRGDYILVVDATGKKSSIKEDEKIFIDNIGKEIVEMEKEKERKEEKNQETISFLIGLLIHLFKNKIVAIGGLSRRLKKMSDPSGEKTSVILKEINNIETMLRMFETALHDIQMAEKLNLESFPFCDIIKPLVATNIKTSAIADKRKMEKFLERIPRPSDISTTEEDQYIKISFPVLENEEMWRAALSMPSPKKGVKNNHSEKQFLLLISIILFKKMGGKVKLLNGFINIFFKKG